MKNKCIKIISLLVSAATVAMLCVGCGDEPKTDAVSSKSAINTEYVEKHAKTIEDIGMKISCDENFIDAKVVRVTPVLDFNDIGISTDDLVQDYYSVYAESIDVDGKRESVRYPDYVDLETGKMKDGFCFFYVEYEITNKNASGLSMMIFDDSGGEYMFPLGRLHGMFNSAGNSYMSSAIAYFEEYGRDDPNYPFTVEVKKGETETVHIGFVLKDTNDTPFTDVGFADGSYLYPDGTAYDYLIKAEFDISAEVAACRAE